MEPRGRVLGWPGVGPPHPHPPPRLRVAHRVSAGGVEGVEGRGNRGYHPPAGTWCVTDGPLGASQGRDKDGVKGVELACPRGVSAVRGGAQRLGGDSSLREGRGRARPSKPVSIPPAGPAAAAEGTPSRAGEERRVPRGRSRGRGVGAMETGRRPGLGGGTTRLITAGSTGTPARARRGRPETGPAGRRGGRPRP